MSPAGAYALLVLGVLFWSGNVITARALHDEIPPFTLSFWRWSLAFLLLWPWIRREARASSARIRRHWRSLAAAGILGMAAYSSLLYLGLQATSATNAALINAALPVVIAAIASVFCRQRLAALQWTGVGLSLAGVVVIVLQNRGAVAGPNVGDLWVLSAVVAFAVYTVAFGSRDAGLSPACYLGVIVGVAAIVCLPLHLWEIAAVPVYLTPAAAAAVGYLAVFPSILSYAFWRKGVATVGSARAGAVLNLLPVFTTALAVFLLDERLTLLHSAGAALILAGIMMTASGRRESRSAANSACRVRHRSHS